MAGSRFGLDSAWPDRRVEAWTWGFVVLGVVLRLVRYALHHPLWGDEAFLASNVLDRDFAGLTRPLNYVQACPLLFLWAEEAMTRAFGFSEWSLRLIPTVASIAGLFQFRHVARRLMVGPAVMLSVAILAVGFYPIRYGGEVKPYSVDFLVALGLISLALEWLRHPDHIIWLWGLTILGPLAVGVSHPAIFVAAGVGLVLLVPVLRSRRPAAVLVLSIFGAATLGVFAVLLNAVTAPQSASVMGVMRRYWASGFPPRGGMGLAAWLAEVHASHMFAYPAGGAHGASTLTTGLVVAAIVAYARRGSRTVLALLLAPFAIGLVAAFAGRYPYGGSARTMQYVAPSIMLMAGLGGAVLLARVMPRRGVGLITILLMVIGVGSLAWDVTHPYKTAPDRESRDFARRFWAEQSEGAEVACARRDLGVPLDPLNWRSDRSALYICHREIYGPGRRKPRFDQIRDNHPLRVVVFGDWRSDRPAIASWLAAMQTRYELRARSERVANQGMTDRAHYYEDFYVVYEFGPRSVAIRRRNAKSKSKISRRDRGEERRETQSR